MARAAPLARRAAPSRKGRARTARLVAAAWALSALGWAGSARSDEPPLQAPAASAAPPAAAAPAPAAKRTGVAVVLVGPWEDVPAKQARDLARGVYRTPKLRPELEEGTVRILSGGEPVGDDPAPKRLADLRRSLSSDLTTPGTREVLDSLAAELSVVAIVLFVPGATGPVVRLAHVDATKSPPKTRLDPASIAPSPLEGQEGALDLEPVLVSLERLIAPKVEVAPPPKAPAAKPKPGPRKDNLTKGKPAGAPAKPEGEETSFFESPWFWVALGGVAATGLTILIVSQTTDVGEGTVALRGKVLP